MSHGAAASENATGGSEIEVKFRMTARGMAKVLSSPFLQGQGDAQAHDLRSVYFDTSTHDFFKSGIILRVRYRDGAAPVLSLKTSAAAGRNFARGEFEVPCPDGQPSLERFEPALAEKLADLTSGRCLVRQFETAVKRRVFTLREGASLIEAACDEGTILAGSAREPLIELELELKSGDAADLFTLSERMASSLPLTLDFSSKSQRGFVLSRSELPRPAKPRPVVLDHDRGIDDAIVSVLSSTLDHFVANWPVLRSSDDPEAVHQMRVALRRMRTALSIFGHGLNTEHFASLRAEAKRMTLQLEAARTWDVLIADALRGPLTSPDCPEDFRALIAAAELKRKAGYRQARSLIEHRQASTFVLSLESMLARRSWTVAAKAKTPVAEFACTTLDRLRRRALKRGRAFAKLDDDGRHRLRIALKNLRYGIDFLGSLGGHPKAAKAYTAKISHLQDLLGAHNDVVTARTAMVELRAESGGTFDGAAGFLLGWLSARSEVDQVGLLEAWRIFRKAKPFWR